MISPARHLSPADIADRFGISIDKVLGWISRGELHAVNVASRAGRRPRWKISPEALANFERARGNRAPAPAPRHQKRVAEDVIAFY